MQNFLVLSYFTQYVLKLVPLVYIDINNGPRYIDIVCGYICTCVYVAELIL